MNILFICKHNVFRSRAAEAYFKKINKNKKIKVTSAGVLTGTNIKPSLNERKALKEQGIKIILKPKNATVPLLKKQDLVIIVADDVPLKLFNNKDYVKKVIHWRIPDVLDNSKEKSTKTVNLIKKRVEKLEKELNRNK